MSDSPDMIFTSGRENLTVRDRIGLLKTNILELESTSAGVPLGAIHTFESTIRWAKRWVINIEQNIRKLEATNGSASVTWSVVLTDKAAKELSEMECDLMAWKRGGMAEHMRTIGRQRNWASGEWERWSDK